MMRGGVLCDLHQRVEDPDVCVLVEERECPADLDVRLRPDAYRSFLGAINVGWEEPEIHVHTVLERGGLEVIASVRAQRAMGRRGGLRLRWPRSRG